MRTAGLVALLLSVGAALQGCPAAGRPWESTVEEPELQPLPPEFLLRKPADFRLYDAHTRKEFYLYFYEDNEVGSETVITVLNKDLPEGEQKPRLATLDEYDYGLSLFHEMWVGQGDEARLRYFQERHREDEARRATLIDQQILYKTRELRTLENLLVDYEADYRSRKEKGTFLNGNEDKVISLPPIATVERLILETKVAILIARAQIDILEYKRRLRNAEYARRGLAILVMNAIRVGDLVGDGIEPAQLIADIKTHVAPDSWDNPQAHLDYSEGNLVVRQTRKVIHEIRTWLDAYRSLRDAKAREKAAEAEKKP